jgi:hypothetical protein
MTPDLTVKDWFAGIAMQALIALDADKASSFHVKSNVELRQAVLGKVSSAYDWAEAMMAERDKRATTKKS